MAEEKKEHDAIKDFWMVLIAFAALVALWFYMGGANFADLRGIFLSPPQPVGSGEAYGPQYDTSTNELPPPPTYETTNAY